MEPFSHQLYLQFIAQRRELLCQSPAYEEAVAGWDAALESGDALEPVDSRNLLMETWGILCFSAGLRLGLSLGHELEDALPDEQGISAMARSGLNPGSSRR